MGPLGTNCFVVSRFGEEEALIVDPGEDPGRVDETLSAGGLRCVGILVTHAHFDHVGAVASLARRHGAPVYISSGEAQGLRFLDRESWPGLGPFEAYEPDVELGDGAQLELANLAIATHLAPGHSPASLVYEISDPADGDTALFVGDVIFRGSVGRTDFPGCSWAELERSIIRLYERCPHDAPVYSGHSAPTTLDHERRTSPFLDAIRRVG